MIRTLGEALAAPEDLPWGDWLLLPEQRPWSPSTPCRVENFDDLPDDVDLPPEAVRDGFTVALGAASVQDIVSNLLQQVTVADLTLRLRAFEYYMENDAFINVSDCT
jgi:hypothetical protein